MSVIDLLDEATRFCRAKFSAGNVTVLRGFLFLRFCQEAIDKGTPVMILILSEIASGKTYQSSFSAKRTMLILDGILSFLDITAKTWPIASQVPASGISRMGLPSTIGGRCDITSLDGWYFPDLTLKVLAPKRRSSIFSSCGPPNWYLGLKCYPSVHLSPGRGRLHPWGWAWDTQHRGGLRKHLQKWLAMLARLRVRAAKITWNQPMEGSYCSEVPKSQAFWDCTAMIGLACWLYRFSGTIPAKLLTCIARNPRIAGGSCSQAHAVVRGWNELTQKWLNAILAACHQQPAWDGNLLERGMTMLGKGNRGCTAAPGLNFGGRMNTLKSWVHASRCSQRGGPGRGHIALFWAWYHCVIVICIVVFIFVSYALCS